MLESKSCEWWAGRRAQVWGAITTPVSVRGPGTILLHFPSYKLSFFFFYQLLTDGMSMTMSSFSIHEAINSVTSGRPVSNLSPLMTDSAPPNRLH